ncbi:uncharacterized protein LOC121250050 isoform X2 [Juglans microcarpa x Juglans regia]|uniref:uncharacterized protein LOC121250050 isoform X2 n=1 Tax=Juglans microcarpa x Juglans regia TaxID=2249226 RepID=UPI001B7F45BC|nr:uncharacterized protein LOC121250050 isoform X2 [Juglans microcarpa x Juglans regia]
MEDRKENAPWLSVPQFGDWDHKGQVPDYSLDFSKIREMRKQNKMDVTRASLGNDEELIASSNTTTTNASSTRSDNHHQHLQHDYPQSQHSPTTRRSFLSRFSCCGKA